MRSKSPDSEADTVKLFHKLIVLGLGGALVAPMFIKGPDGQPLMTFADWIPKDAVAMVDQVSTLGKEASGLESKSGKQIFYKWKDESGVWQLTQFRPTHLAASDIEERTIYSNANIIKSLDSSEITTALSSGEKPKPKFTYNPKPESAISDEDLKAQEDKGLSLTTVSMKDIPKLINQAKSVDTIMKGRMESINQQVGAE